MRKLLIVSLSFALAASTACSNLDLHDPQPNIIRASIRSCSMPDTKSAAAPVYVRTIGCGSGDFILEEYVSDRMPCRTPGTKGAVVTDGRTSVYSSNHNPITSKQINLEGWLNSDIDSGDGASQVDKDDHHFVKGEHIDHDGSVWNTGRVNHWRNGITSSFWSYVLPSVGVLDIDWPSDKPSSDSEINSLDFTYSLPSPNGTSDATMLEDFLFAHNVETRDIDPDSGMLVSGQSASMDIELCHPLAAVKFEVGSLNGSTSSSASDYVNITKIELVDVPTGGSFTASGVRSALDFSCTPSTDKATYAQSASVSRSAIQSGMFTAVDSDNIFFMIPQEDLSGVKVRVTFTKRSAAGQPLQTIERTASLTGSWESGKYYTYRISAWINVLGEELHFTDPRDESGKSVSGNIAFDSRSSTTESRYIKTINLSGVKYIRMEWTQSWKNADKASVAQLYLYDPTQSSVTTATKGSYTYGGTSYNGIYDAKAKGFPTTGNWVFKLDGEFNEVALCVSFLNSGSGGSSCLWTINNVENIKFTVLELM